MVAVEIRTVPAESGGENEEIGSLGYPSENAKDTPVTAASRDQAVHSKMAIVPGPHDHS